MKSIASLKTGLRGLWWKILTVVLILSSGCDIGSFKIIFDISSIVGFGALTDSNYHFTAVGSQSDGKMLVATPYNNGAFRLYRFNQDGTDDNTFGADPATNWALSPSTDYNQFVSKILVDGHDRVWVLFTAGGSNGAYGVARYLANGQIDTSFGLNGLRTKSVSSASNPMDMAFAPDGSVIVTGHSTTLPSTNWDCVALRFTSNGTFDTTFGSAGVFKLNLGSTYDACNGVAIEQLPTGDYSIYLAGGSRVSGQSYATIVRLTSTGILDTSFATSGNQFWKNLFIQPLTENRAYQMNGTDGITDIKFYDGKLYAIIQGIDPFQSYKGTVGIFSLNTDGTYNTEFGNAGGRLHVLGGTSCKPLEIERVKDLFDQTHLFVAVNKENTDTGNRALFLNLRADGSLDMATSTNGLLISDFGSTANSATLHRIAASADGYQLFASGARKMSTGTATQAVAFRGEFKIVTVE